MLREDLVALAAFGTATFWQPMPMTRPPKWYIERPVPVKLPSWVFPVAWYTLYSCITASLWLYWRRSTCDGTNDPCTDDLWFWGLAAVYLVLNKAWSPIFFSSYRTMQEQMRSHVNALWVLLAGWGTAMAMTFVAWHERDNYGDAPWLLLVPLLLWTGVAAYLNWQYVLPPANTQNTRPMKTALP